MTNTRKYGYVEEKLQGYNRLNIADVVFYLWMSFIIGSLTITFYFACSPTYATTFENYQHLTPSEYIFQESIKAGVNPTKVLMLVQAESGFDRYTVNKNRNGSFDYGIWQINDIRGVSKECRFSIVCSTKWSLNEIKQHGFGAWYSARYLGLDKN